MAKTFNEYTYDDAVTLVGPKAPVTSSLASSLIGTNTRRPASALSATKFFEGNHWQNSDGFIGQLPPASLPGAQQIMSDIQSGFVSENVVQEVVETHVGGILGREPLWSLVREGQKDADPDEATQELLTPWWNEREALQDLQRSAQLLALEGIAVRRLFIPKGRMPEDGQLSAGDVESALDLIYFETVTADVGMVYTDPNTQFQLGIYLFEEKDDEGEIIDNAAELSFLDENGDTVCRIVRDKGEDEEFGPYQLGGRLLIHELKRRPLITEQVQSNQRALNLAHTMMMRNVNMAGARERAVTNAQSPKRPITVQGSTSSTSRTELQPGTYETGGGAVMFLMGFPIRDDNGNIVGYTNPNVTISDPAPVEVFENTIDAQKTAIYSQCHQRHVLISGDATSSGRSREQARAEFERSLKESKTVLDGSGRWQVETALRLAAQLANQSKTYIDLRCDFNCLIDSGDVDPEKARMVMDMRKGDGVTGQPLISDETARNMVGIDDAAAEKQRVEAEAEETSVTQVNAPAIGRASLPQAPPNVQQLLGAARRTPPIQ